MSEPSSDRMVNDCGETWLIFPVTTWSSACPFTSADDAVEPVSPGMVPEAPAEVPAPVPPYTSPEAVPEPVAPVPADPGVAVAVPLAEGSPAVVPDAVPDAVAPAPDDVVPACA